MYVCFCIGIAKLCDLLQFVLDEGIISICKHVIYPPVNKCRVFVLKGHTQDNLYICIHIIYNILYL